MKIMQLPLILVYALTFTAKIKYVLIFIGALVEGPVLMVAAGFMLRYEVVTVIPLYTALVLGDLTGDIIWYYAGYYFAEPIIRKHGKHIGVTPEVFEKGKKLFAHYHEKVLILSKITLGFGMAVGVLMTAGATKVPFKKYLLLNTIGELLLVTGLLLIGYFFGEVHALIPNQFKIGFIVLLVLLITGAGYGISRYINKKKLEL